MANDQLQNVDDFLEHFGVLGMHWGVRKTSIRTDIKSLQDAHKTHAKAKAATQLSKVQGNKTAAKTRVVGKTVLLNLVAGAAGRRVLGTAARSNKKVAIGLATVTGAFAVANWAKTVSEINAINNA